MRRIYQCPSVQLLDSLPAGSTRLAGDIHLTWNGELPLTFTEGKSSRPCFHHEKSRARTAFLVHWRNRKLFHQRFRQPYPGRVSDRRSEQSTSRRRSSWIRAKPFAQGSLPMMSIANGNQPPLTFRWIYPTGDTASNDPFFFSVTQADAGLYTLIATDRVGCTDQKSIELIVSDNPVAAFHGTDTLEMQAGDVLDAGAGLSSYLWNTGDSTESIVINAEGMYLVEMESPIGCIVTDSVYVKLVSEEIPEFDFYVPNAFSPNGDGINDIFQIIFPNSTFNIQHLTLSIFDRWGGEVFSGEGASTGWDGKKAGKDCPGGVYVYKIVFSLDGVPGSQERVGTVMLIR
jgi:gliding motility-associated-like protein